MAVQIKKLLSKVAGFSLIELMIVVAIIGILASVAIPSYEGYVARAKLTHLMAFSDEIRKKVAEYRAINGTFPHGNAGTSKGYLGTILTIPQDPYIDGTSASNSYTAGSSGVVVTIDGDKAKYTIVGTGTGFPGGDPVIQLQAEYTQATATQAAVLKWTCVGGMINSGSLTAVAGAAAQFYSEGCPADTSSAVTF